MAIKKSKCEDKSRYDIVADLRKRGKSLAALGRENGLSISTVKNALDKPYPFRLTGQCGVWSGFHAGTDGRCIPER